MCYKCNVTSDKDALEAALSEASMENKTVVIAIVNKAYVEGDKPMLDLFLDSLWLGEDTRKLVDHLLLVAVDETSFERCKFLRLHCYRLQMDDGVDSNGEKVYMSDSFIKMMWRRTLFLREVLKRDYSFVFTVCFYLKFMNIIIGLFKKRETKFEPCVCRVYHHMIKFIKNQC